MLTGSCHCGKASWRLEGDPGSITACNCTLCRRYGVLWAYDYEGERITLSGETASYTRAGRDNPSLEILFCPTCACVLSWRSMHLQKGGRRGLTVPCKASTYSRRTALEGGRWESATDCGTGALQPASASRAAQAGNLIFIQLNLLYQGR
jgi:hypothetical protein